MTNAPEPPADRSPRHEVATAAAQRQGGEVPEVVLPRLAAAPSVRTAAREHGDDRLPAFSTAVSDLPDAELPAEMGLECLRLTTDTDNAASRRAVATVEGLLHDQLHFVREALAIGPRAGGAAPRVGGAAAGTSPG